MFYEGADRLIQYLKANSYGGAFVTVVCDGSSISGAVSGMARHLSFILEEVWTEMRPERRTAYLAYMPTVLPIVKQASTGRLEWFGNREDDNANHDHEW